MSQNKETQAKSQPQGADLIGSSGISEKVSDLRFDVSKIDEKLKSSKQEIQTKEKANDPQYYLSLEEKYYPENFKTEQIVIAKAKGCEYWDVTGKRYIDFASAYCTVNHGHCHPKIVNAMYQQAQTLTMTSKFLHSNVKGPFQKLMCELFQFDKVLFMNSGAEAVESAIKLARRWGYDKKKIAEDKATILFAHNNYHGLLIGTTGASDDKSSRHNFGPFGDQKFDHVHFDDVKALEDKFKSNKNIVAYLVEPVQGKGIQFAKEGYFKAVRELCDQYNVLFICDEIQMGLGRCGKLLAVDWYGVKPDIVTLGKPLSGGFYPLSCVLANDEVMMGLKPGDHASTYEGNPLACAIGKAAIEVMCEENLIGNSAELGVYLFEQLKAIKTEFIMEVKGGKGLLAAMMFDDKMKDKVPEVVKELIENGLILNPTEDLKGNKGLKFAPPLVITKELIDEAVQILKKVLDSFK